MPHLLTVSIVVLAVGFALNLAAPAQAQQPLDRSLQMQPVPGGLALNAAHIWAPSEQFDRIADTGVSYIRHATFWKEIERQKGEYDFSRMQGVVDALEPQGVGVLFILAYNNPLYENHGAAAIITDEGRQAFADFCAAAAEHFRGRKVIWEIWNEPNVRTFWDRQRTPNSDEYADEYVALVNEVVPAMRKADPRGVIFAGSVSCLWKDSYSWSKRCFEQGILANDFDAWSVHPYNFKRPEDYFAAYEHMRKLMREHGGRTKIMVNTERGFPLGEAEGFAGGDRDMQEEFQAAHFVRQYMVDMLCDIRMTVWYRWNDPKFGIVHGQNERPALQACKTLTTELNGYKLIDRVKTESDLDFVLLFRNARGEDKLVAWTAPPEGKSPDQAVDHELVIPVGRARSITATDLYGKDLGSLPVRGGKTQVTLTAFPQYLTLR